MPGFNPFIHGTSSQTLSQMQGTDFHLMPVIAMLQNFKTAPMVGELTQGGFTIIGEGSNDNTITGAPSFGCMHHSHYGLNKVIQSYTEYANNTSLETHKENFKYHLEHSHKSAFTELNLLMIYLVRLRQLGVKVEDVASAEEINILKERLNASVQFYYFILCIQKHIFIDGAEMERFKNENNLDGYYGVGDYIAHYFSFENFIEKLGKTGFSIEEIYNSPSQENINKLVEFIKIAKDSQENVTRYPSGEDAFIAKRDYHFFTPDKPELGSNVNYATMGGYLFTNNSGYSLTHYLEEYYQGYSRLQKKDQKNDGSYFTVPDFEEFHGTVLPYIEAMKDRIQLCNTLLNADDNEFALHNKNDELITKPFPVIFVTEAETIEDHRNEYRSRAPLKLGKEILLVATDNKTNQQKVRDYLQKNNVGPVEVLLFDDLKTLSLRQDANYFDALANDDFIKAFELAKQQNCVAQFSKLYRAFAELNEKRYQFKSTNQEMYEKLNNLFTELEQNILSPDKDKINFNGIQELLHRNKQENYVLYATHRGALGIIDTILTVLASLVVFYPITYMVQKGRNSTHTFFATDTEKKISSVVDAADEAVDKGLSDDPMSKGL